MPFLRFPLGWSRNQSSESSGATRTAFSPWGGASLARLRRQASRRTAFKAAGGSRPIQYHKHSDSCVFRGPPCFRPKTLKRGYLSRACVFRGPLCFRPRTLNRGYFSRLARACVFRGPLLSSEDVKSRLHQPTGPCLCVELSSAHGCPSRRPAARHPFRLTPRAGAESQQRRAASAGSHPSSFDAALPDQSSRSAIKVEVLLKDPGVLLKDRGLPPPTAQKKKAEELGGGSPPNPEGLESGSTPKGTGAH